MAAKKRHSFVDRVYGPQKWTAVVHVALHMQGGKVSKKDLRRVVEHALTGEIATHVTEPKARRMGERSRIPYGGIMTVTKIAKPVVRSVDMD